MNCSDASMPLEKSPPEPHSSLFPLSKRVNRMVIFDFDGTIADSFSIGVKIGNQLAREFGFPTITMATIDRWQHLSSKEIIHEIGVPFYRLPKIIRRFKSDMNREIPHLQPFDGMKEALRTLRSQGCRLGIVSSNSEDNVRSFLAVQSISHLFEFVISCPRLMGKDKALKRILKKQNIQPETVLYVGDETRDIDAAKRSNIRSAAVSWGFNSLQVLAQHYPDFILTEPADLNKIVLRF
ncbi:MAG: HAD-IA family hydrolase [Cyanobacteria bacterium]|nr:HAD-IA family hydrolase [Cyanobacteriota bacterium]